MEDTFENAALPESLSEAIEWFVVDQFGMCERSHEIAQAILAMPEMQLVHDLLNLLTRTDGVRDLVLGNLATHPALLEWVTQ